MKKKITLLGLLVAFLLCICPLYAEEEARGVWVTIWNSTTEAEIQEIVDKVDEYNFNQIYAHIRYRGDAYYEPNREDTTYENPEPRNEYVDTVPQDLDVLQTFIDYADAKESEIEVHAWVVLYPATTANMPEDPNHIYNRKPEWMTVDQDGNSPEGDEYLEPGVPGVNEYLRDVCMDIVMNYDIDGLHFDYIRYDGTEWGYNPEALDQFEEDTGVDSDDPRGEAVWNTWRRQQINSFVEMFYREAMSHETDLQVTAAVVSFLGTDPRQGQLSGHDYWSARGFMDAVIPMVYSVDIDDMRSRYDMVAEESAPYNRHIYAGLGPYQTGMTPEILVDQVEELRDIEDNTRPEGYVFFAYAALTENDDAMFKALRDGPFSERVDPPSMDWKPDDVLPPPAEEGDEIIAHNEQMFQFYEDGENWGTSTWGVNFGDSKRLYDGDSPMAVWVLDVPEGRDKWHARLEACLTPEASYSDEVSYRFSAYDSVDDEIIGPDVYSVQRSQYQLDRVDDEGDSMYDLGLINIDGREDDPIEDTFIFKPGQKVYVIVYNETEDSEDTVVADGVRLRLLGGNISDWHLY